MKKRVMLFILCAALFCGCAKEEMPNASLYFVTADKKEIVSEPRVVAAEGSDLVHATVEALLKGPVGAGMTRIIPTETTLLGVEMVGTVAEVNFSAAFDTGSTEQRLLSRYTVIYTVCALPDVQKARLLVEGKPLTSLRDGTVLGALGAADVSGGDKLVEAAEVVTLYFMDEKSAALVPESRQIILSAGQNLETAAVQEIIRGPRTAGHLPALAPETVVLSVETQEKVCFVNLGANFLTVNASHAEMAVYAIVNTLCTFSQIEEVRFLVEGETVETFGNLPLSESFTANI